MNIGINISLSESDSVRPVLFESTLDDGFGDIVTGYLMSFTKLTQNVLNGIKEIYAGPNSCDNEESVTGVDGIPPIKRIICVLLLFLCLNVFFFVKLPSNTRARYEVSDHVRSETSRYVALHFLISIHLNIVLIFVIALVPTLGLTRKLLV